MFEFGAPKLVVDLDVVAELEHLLVLLLLQEVLKLGAPRFLVDAEGDAEVVVLLEVFEF